MDPYDGGEMLSDKDRAEIERFLNNGVLLKLKDIESSPESAKRWEDLRFRARLGASLVCCGDCDYTVDTLKHTWERISDRTQLHTPNGGALALDPLCPANEEFSWHREYLLPQIRMPWKRKKLSVLILRADYPCAFGKQYGYTPSRTLAGLLQAMDFLMDEGGWKEEDFILKLHVSYHHARERTYLVDRESALAEVTNPLVA